MPATVIEYATVGSVTESWQENSFNAPVNMSPKELLNREPVVFAQMQATNGADPAGVRISNVSSSGFNVMIEEEASLDTELRHNAEAVGYLALLEGKIFDKDGNQIGEAGRVQGDHQWLEVNNLTRNYTDPVVIAMMNTYLGAEPAHVRLSNINSNSFEFKIEEWDYLDGLHTEETISYIVVEAGEYELSGGINLEVKKTQAHTAFALPIPLSRPFEQVPIVFSQSQTFDSDVAVVTRQDNININSLALKLQTEEVNATVPATETVGIIAIGVIAP